MKLVKSRLWIFGAVLIIALAVIIFLADRHSSKMPSVASTSKSEKISAKPLISQSITVQKGQIVSGPSTINVAVGQRLRISAKGLGYSEGDSLVLQGYPGAFFELDELDDPTVIYLTFSKAGTYPLVISATGQKVGEIIVS